MFELKLLFRIVGISSASGLALLGDSLYIISDNSTYLYEYHVPSAKLDRIPLQVSAAENIPKAEKYDFEAITTSGNYLIIIGSGSTANRKKMAAFGTTDLTPFLVDASVMYDLLMAKSGLTANDLNIEGVVRVDELIYMLQRGNAEAAKNGIFKIDGPDVEFTPIALPKINGIAAGFTDATLADGKLYFLAAAENSLSTYHDGDVAGCMIGSIDLDTLKVIRTQVISSEHKFEGITPAEDLGHSLRFLLCEDSDTEAEGSDIYELTIKKQNILSDDPNL